MRQRTLLASGIASVISATGAFVLHQNAIGGGTVCGSIGPDVIVGEIPGVTNYSSSGGIEAFSIGTTSCNIGDEELAWFSQSTQHPVIGQNLFRLSNGRFEQIGQAWLKHGFTALQLDACGCGCQSSGTGNFLGVGCSDPYSSGLNGSQGGMGPKFEVNAATGGFLFPPTDFSNTGNSIYKRLQVATSDLAAGGSFYWEAQYIAPDDTAAGNGFNNVSWRSATISGSGSNWDGGLSGSTQRESPAIDAWAQADASVELIAADVPGDGRFILGWKATANGGSWDYEFALYNMNSDRSAGGVRLPLPSGTTVTNIGFHDVAYHSGEPYDGTDWAIANSGVQVEWTTIDDFATDPNANALRWGTMYNFRFTADAAPGELTEVEVDLFKPGAPTSIIIPLTPAPPANDACGDAVAVGRGTINFDTSLATAGGPVESCGSFDADVWYSWTANCTGDATFTVCGSELAIYAACPAGPGETLACSADSCPGSEVVLPVTAGDSLLVRVGGAPGAGSLNISCNGGGGDDNDDCANAAPIADGATAYDTTQATTDGDVHGECEFDGQTYNDIWFEYVAPCDGTLLVTTCEELGGSATYDTDLVVYEGCDCSSLILLGCNDDDPNNPCGSQGGGYHSTVSVGVVAANCYRIRVGGWSVDDSGIGSVFVDGPDAGDCGPPAEGACCLGGASCSEMTLADCLAAGGVYQGDQTLCSQVDCDAGSNDDCVGAETIVAGDTAFSTIGANTDGPAHAECEFDGQTYHDIWFAYTADCTGDLTVSTCNTADYDTDLVIYDGCDCGSLNLLGCNDDTDGCSGFSSQLTVGVVAGNCYLLRVGGWDPDSEGSGTVSVSCSGVKIVDCNGNGIDDAVDIADGTSQDCNSNDVPDACDILNGTSVDCAGGPLGDETSGQKLWDSICINCHGVDGSGGVGPDIRNYTRVEIWTELLPPTDHPGGAHPEYTVQDFANLEAFLDTVGGSGGRADMVPDECQTDLVDCDNDGTPDACELDAGTQVDVNYDGVPDDCQVTCLGDVNEDGAVDVSDLLIVLADWGTCVGCPADIDADGLVNVNDLLILLANWGPCP